MSKLKTILIIDDNEGDHVLTKLSIAKLDPSIKVLSAYNGEEGLEAVQPPPPAPDLIFLDINMPRMNGLEFLDKFSKIDSTQPSIAVLTSSDNPSEKTQCLAYNCVKSFIVKPLGVDDLIQLSNVI